MTDFQMLNQSCIYSIGPICWDVFSCLCIAGYHDDILIRRFVSMVIVFSSDKVFYMSSFGIRVILASLY